MSMIAFGLNGQIEEAMLGQQLQHVVEKPDAGVDLALPAAVQRPFDANVGFLRRSMQRGLSGGRSVFLHENLLWADLACASNPSM